MKPARLLLFLGLALLAAGHASAGILLVPEHVAIANDEEALAGDAVKITWTPPPATFSPQPVLYRVYLGEEPGKLEVAVLAEGADKREAGVPGLQVGHEYYAQVGAVYLPAGAKLEFSEEDPNEVATPGAQEVKSPLVGPARTVGRWYNPELTNVLVLTVFFCALTLVVLYYARRREMYIRPIAGLQAVEDAIGRATEMGRPLLYVSGLGGASDIATIAAMLVLGHLARKTAPYGTRLIAPVSDSMVMTAEREIVSQAYLHAGRPELFNAEDIFFVTDSQFGYVTAVAGLMMRERPAVNFFMGYFAAESLVLAETGNVIDALQIAGTDSDTQLPFFITACDYTLMGEELYAASAYLSRDPILLAQLKAQDIGKALLASLVVVGVALALISGATGDPVGPWFLSLLKT